MRVVGTVEIGRDFRHGQPRDEDDRREKFRGPGSDLVGAEERRFCWGRRLDVPPGSEGFRVQIPIEREKMSEEELGVMLIGGEEVVDGEDGEDEHEGESYQGDHDGGIAIVDVLVCVCCNESESLRRSRVIVICRMLWGTVLARCRSSQFKKNGNTQCQI